MSENAEQTLRNFWDRINQRDWAGLGQLLTPGLQTRYLATDELIDGAEGFVRLNAEYSGRWRVTVLDLVAAGDRAVTCARLDAEEGSEAHYVTSFATVRDGLVADLTELWADAGQEVPQDRRPAPAGNSQQPHEAGT